MLYGLIEMAWWGYILVALVFTHVTIAAVTIFLHRCQAHRALELHPVVSHFFRVWLWLTTAMETKQWAAIHRKHHAKCETPEDPHSPQILGISKVLCEGAELYHKEAKNQETMDKYGHGTPDDWVERNVYVAHPDLGIKLMLVIDVALFGPLGLSIWAVQMMWIPIFAAGIINGMGHYWGYRNFAADDASTNILPWGILIGGEELHNNHHAYPTSAKLSSKWFEFDLGWFYIRIMKIAGLARVKKVAPQVRLNLSKGACDLETLQAVITHRYEVMAKYGYLLKKVYREEIVKIHSAYKLQGRKPGVLAKVRHWLHLDEEYLLDQDKKALQDVLALSSRLSTIYQLRQELATLWGRSTASQEQLLQSLDDWCCRAEASGISALKAFSCRLRSYAM